jgi:hypothetical protein
MSKLKSFNRAAAMNMEQILVVTSNCQSHGISSSLDLMLPNFKSVPIWSLSGLDFIAKEINKNVRGDFIWVTILKEDEQKTVIRNLKKAPSKIIQIPEIFFDAFHPDMTYAQLNSGELLESALGHYHSKIVLWCFLNNLSASDTLQFFKHQSFYQLGYLELHENSMLQLKKSIANCGLDLYPFLGVIRHSESFMHTFNHPKVSILSAMAKSICLKLKLSPAVDHVEVSQILRDALFEAGPIFPIYPEIANFFGLEGTYMFRRQDGQILNLVDFIEKSFLIYEDVNTNQLIKEFLFTENFHKRMQEIAVLK